MGAYVVPLLNISNSVKTFLKSPICDVLLEAGKRLRVADSRLRLTQNRQRLRRHARPMFEGSLSSAIQRQTSASENPAR